jgi:hypothetical protein
MIEDHFQTPFSKALMTGVFLGIISTLICFAYAITFRMITHFGLSDFINVGAIIFGCNLALLICGILYHYFRQSLPGGHVAYIFVFGLLTLFCIWKTASIVRSPVHQETIEFRQLLTGIIIILGVSATFGIPFLYANEKFQDKYI